ncbi:MAG: hypothetical protein RI894_1863 [Bacteroidota bacterium]|jgi:hypothetical protein
MLRHYMHVQHPARLSELEYWEAVAEMDWLLEEREPLTADALRTILQQIIR